MVRRRSLGRSRVTPITPAPPLTRTHHRTGHANKSDNPTGGEALSQQEIAAKLSKKLGKTVTYVDLPVADLVKGMQGAGLPAWYAQDLGTMNGWFATGLAAAVDPTLATLIGRKPYTYDDFLDVFGAAFQ